MVSRRYKLSGSVCARTVAGMVCGFLLGVYYQQTPCLPHTGDGSFGAPDYIHGYAASKNNPHREFRTGVSNGGQANLGDFSNPAASGKKGQIFIGIMTAKKFLNTRALAAHRTWATTIPGRVMFFSSEGSERDAPAGVPVVGIPGVDDAYPPQKKSFLLLKYMHDYFIDDYEWFMRADDDVYVKGDDLSKFLYTINSSQSLFIGQAGLGNKDEFGQLSLDHGENFCMGGPGMIFSRRTLQLIAPHISYCLQNLYTTHEDVEVGRCVQRFAGVSCTWAFEMQQFFYQNHIEPNGSFTHPLKVKEVRAALTLHPVKNPVYQYRLHSYMQGERSSDLRHNLLLLQREISAMNRWLNLRAETIRHPHNVTDPLGLAPSLMKHVPASRDDVLAWQFIDHRLYSHRGFNPKRGMDASLKSAFDSVVMQVMEQINLNSKQRGRTIGFKDILYGYRRVSPIHGADYILDLLLVYKKFKGRKITVPVRRHAYLQQTFCEIEFIEDTDLREERFIATQDVSSVKRTKRSSLFQILQNKIVNLPFIGQTPPDKPSDDLRRTRLSGGGVSPHTQLYFILPLSGRYETFLQFMANFEDECLLAERKVTLAVMLFHNEAGLDRSTDTIDCVRSLQVKYPQHDLRVVQLKGPFSRGLALEQGSRLFSPRCLLVFMDVDMYLNRGAVDRFRWNAIIHTQVYYPVVFSQYDPDVTCDENSAPCRRFSPFHFSTDAGYWRRFGYGIASMYNADYRAIGGFDTSIQGWGKEDVDLYSKFLASNLTVLRAIDPGLVHIFHPIICDPNLEPSQYKMCLGSRASSFGSEARLAEIVYRTPEILNKDEVVIDAAAANKDEEGQNSFLNVHQEFGGNNKDYDDVHGKR